MPPKPYLVVRPRAHGIVTTESRRGRRIARPPPPNCARLFHRCANARRLIFSPTHGVRREDQLKPDSVFTYSLSMVSRHHLLPCCENAVFVRRRCHVDHAAQRSTANRARFAPRLDTANGGPRGDNYDVPRQSSYVLPRSGAYAPRETLPCTQVSAPMRTVVAKVIHARAPRRHIPRRFHDKASKRRHVERSTRHEELLSLRAGVLSRRRGDC